MVSYRKLQLFDVYKKHILYEILVIASVCNPSKSYKATNTRILDLYKFRYYLLLDSLRLYCPELLTKVKLKRLMEYIGTWLSKKESLSLCLFSKV